MRFHHIAVLLTLLLLVPASPAAAASWESAGSLEVSSKAGEIRDDVVDSKGVYSALWSPILRDEEIEHGQPSPVFGPVVEIVRAPGGKLVKKPGFGASNAVLAATRDGGRIAVSVTGAKGKQQIEVRRRTATGKWSKPKRVAGAQAEVKNLDIDVAPTGEAVISWVNDLDVPGAADAALLVATQRAGAKTFFEPQVLEDQNVDAATVDLDDKGNGYAVWIDSAAGGARISGHVARSDQWGPSEVVTAPGYGYVGSVSRPYLAVADGRALIGWNVGADGTTNNVAPALALATVTVRQEISVPRVVSPSASGPALAGDGDTLAATWAHGSSTMIQAITLKGNDALADATIETLSTQGDAVADPSVVVAKDRATFSWSRRTVLEPAKWNIEARSIDSSAKLGRRQTIAPSGTGYGAGGLTADSAGDPWLLFGVRSGNKTTPMVARASVRSGKFAKATKFRGNSSELLAGRKGTMLAPVTKKNTVQLLVYGE